LSILSILNKQTKAGYIAIVGLPNAGKSSLLNAILGTKLSIVTSKPQTTRKSVIGIHTTNNAQLIFIDTPGILKPNYELQEIMVSYLKEAISSSDIIALIIDSSDFANSLSLIPKEIFYNLKNSDKPIIAILSKIDKLKDTKLVLPQIQKLSEMELFRDIAPISSTKNAGIKELIDLFINYLPSQDFLFDPEDISTQNERFFVAEIIREKIFQYFKEEIPYSSDINIEQFKERISGKCYISATINIERQSQKRKIIVAKGAKIKQIGEKARADIEKLLGKPVFLELFVRVREGWRDDKDELKEFGY
jgi:GTP-binding protein Era